MNWQFGKHMSVCHCLHEREERPSNTPYKRIKESCKEQELRPSPRTPSKNHKADGVLNLAHIAVLNDSHQEIQKHH